MIPKVLIALPLLCHTAFSRAVPLRANAKFDLVGLAAPVPVSTPVSDWQKDGEVAEWAEGYPKQWGSEAVKYTQVEPRHGSLFGPGTVTPDEKFLIMINDTNTRITNLDTGKTVADFAQTGDGARTTASPKGGYDLLISTPRPQYTGYDIYHYTLSKKGVPVGEPVKLYGETTPFDPDVFYSRRYTANQRNEAFIYDLDKPDSKLTLDGHTDDIMSASWSPDGEYVATAAWDGKGKLWSAHNGSFIADFENSTAQNWVTRFSPDGEYIAIANGARTLKIYTVADLNAPPIVINGFSDWIRNLQWSPDGEYIAAGSWGQVLVYSLSETKVVQKWELDTEGKGSFEVVDVTWLEGGSRIAYRYQATLEVYDFESNLKYAWGPGANDTYLLGFNVGGTFLLENRGWIGGFDWDHRVRFWEYPETERVTT